MCAEETRACGFAHSETWIRLLPVPVAVLETAEAHDVWMSSKYTGKETGVLKHRLAADMRHVVCACGLVSSRPPEAAAVKAAANQLRSGSHGTAGSHADS